MREEEITIKELYSRLVALEAKVDFVKSTKLETLRELRIGTAVLIVLGVINILVHLFSMIND